MGIYHNQLRYFSAAGELIATPQEAALQSQILAETERQRAETENQRAETERQRAETEHQRAERLAERLRALGINPD